MTHIKAFYVSLRGGRGDTIQRNTTISGMEWWNSVSCADSKLGTHGANGAHIIKSFAIRIKCFYVCWKM